MPAAPPKEIKVSELSQHYGIRRVQATVFGAAFLTIVLQAAIIGPCPLVLDSIKLEFGVSDAAAALVASCVLGASAIGVAVFGRVIDAVGRRKGMIIYTCIALVLSLLHFAVPRGPSDFGFYMLIALRSLTGIPYGGILVNQYQYISEVLPDYARGTVAAGTLMGWNLCHLYLLPFVPIYKDDAPWRLILALLPLAPAILILAACYFIPESPRWLLTGGLQEEAQESLSVIFASPPIYGSASVGEAPRVDVSGIAGRDAFGMTQEPVGKALYMLFSPGLLRTTLLTSTMYAGLAGLSNTLWTWSPLILREAAGMKPESNIFMYGEACGLIGVVFTMLVIDRVPRRMYIFILFLLKGALVATLLHSTSTEGSSTTSPFFVWPMTVWYAIYVAMCVLGGAVWPPVCLYVSEAFPTGLRSTANGVAYTMGRLASLIGPSLAGMVVRQSYKSVVLPAALLWFAFGSMALAIPKETSNMPLPDVVEDDANPPSVTDSVGAA